MSDKMTMAMERIRRYVAMRKAQPMKQLGDHVHCIHTGTDWEAELLFSDIEALAAAPPPPGNIGADSPSAREKALEAARSRIQAIYDSPNNSRSPDYWAGLADALFEVETLISSALESSK